MNKVLAMLIAACMVLAMVGPSVMADSATSSATVNDVAPTITSITITPDDDSSTNGVQINPVINGDKTVTVTVVVADGNGLDDIDSVSLVSVLDGQTTPVAPLSGAKSVSSMTESPSGTYTDTFTMAYYDNPDDYTVLVTVTDGTTPVDGTAVFTYTTAEGIDVDATTLAFGKVAPGGDSEFSPAAVVKNTGNSDYTVQVLAKKLESTSTANIDEILASDVVETGAPATIGGTALSNGLSSSVSGAFKLDTISVGLLPGAYAGSVDFNAV